MSPICQSCGMPLSKDPSGGGTEADGSISGKYCSLCYHQGHFVQPDLTVEQMMDKVKHVLKEKNIPGFLAGMLAQRTKKLERWRQSSRV